MKYNNYLMWKNIFLNFFGYRLCKCQSVPKMGTLASIFQHALFIRPKIYLKRFNSPHTTILTVTCYFNEMFK